MAMTTCNYLIEYTDPKSKNLKIDELIKNNDFNDAEINTHDLSEDISFNKVLEDLDTYLLLSPKKVVIIDNINLLKEDIEKEALYKYLDNPKEDTMLIMTTSKLDNKLKLFKELKKKANYISASIDPISFIKDNLDDYKMSSADINYLINYTDNNITNLYNELEKLKNYKYDSKEITKDDIINLVIKKKIDKDKTLFDLIDAIIRKNKRLATSYLDSLKKENIDSLSIIALLDTQLRVLLQTFILKEDNYTKEEIADELNIHPFRVQKALENIINYSKEEINNLIINLSTLDYSIKSGRIEKDLSIDMFIFNLKR